MGSGMSHATCVRLSDRVLDYWWPQSSYMCPSVESRLELSVCAIAVKRSGGDEALLGSLAR